jgi:hypothetical protein
VRSQIEGQGIVVISNCIIGVLRHTRQGSPERGIGACPVFWTFRVQAVPHGAGLTCARGIFTHRQLSLNRAESRPTIVTSADGALPRFPGPSPNH